MSIDTTATTNSASRRMTPNNNPNPRIIPPQQSSSSTSSSSPSSRLLLPQDYNSTNITFAQFPSSSSSLDVNTNDDNSKSNYNNNNNDNNTTTTTTTSSSSVHLTRICHPSHLSSLPPEFLSNSTHYNHQHRPLLHAVVVVVDHPPLFTTNTNTNDDNRIITDDTNNVMECCCDYYTYYLNPMKHAVFFILAIEMLERFSFYGINYTTTAYLTGEYNDDWNANMPSILASSYVSISTAVAYTTPFLGALLADNFLGEYMTILLGSILCYIPGLLLIALTTIPQFLGREFNHTAIRWGLLILWPVGTGTVKACVNVFGAKQFHPILQSSFIESYYVNFYMCINIGALTGGIVVPLVAQRNITLAYFIPVAMLGLGVVMFVVGTKRYVRPKPSSRLNLQCNCQCWNSLRRNYWSSLDPPSSNTATTIKMTNSPKYERTSMNIQSSSTESKVGIGTIVILSSLVVPFNVAYAQMATTFIVQGSVMSNFGVVDAPLMNNADAVSVLAFGYIIGNIIYPALNRRGIKIPTTYKFAIGSAFGALAVGCAILTDYRIHRVYHETGEAITVLWQAFPYFLIGIGEIFAVSAAYELAFTVAPSKMKSVASAANLFMVGGLPNVFCIMLYNACRDWFLNKHGEAHIHKLKDYASAKVVNYFWLVEAISLIGVVINILPSVKNWVESIEDTAAESISSPISTPVIRKKLMQKKQHHSRHSKSRSMTAEETPLINAQRQAMYINYSERPELRKMASFRAGQSSKSVKSSATLPRYHGRPPQSPAADENQKQLYTQIRNALALSAVDTKDASSH